MGAVARGSALVACLTACSTKAAPEASTYLSTEDLMSPGACASCHAEHFRQWSGSMHAYASEDPLFVAMNARAQRETNGKTGTFCVKCHAPVAVMLGKTTDGTNLASLPASMRGVTCFACHAAEGVAGLHNNALTYGAGVMRAAIADPIANKAHPMAYSPLHDRERLDSAQLCGSCHDVQLDNGLDVERTFAEWHGSLFAHDDPTVRLTCGSCHMRGSDGVAATIAGAPSRRVHDHAMAGVDLALTAFPDSDAQKQLVQAGLDSALTAKLCVTGQSADVSLEATFVGHGFPSGSSHDRRAWIELVAYAKGQVVFQSGVVPDGQAVVGFADPSLWLLRERLFDARKTEVRMLWQAVTTEPSQLAVAVTADRSSPSFDRAVKRSYAVPATTDRVTLRVLFQPIGHDVLDDLVASHDLDVALRAKLPTFTLASTKLEWRAALGNGCVR